MRLTVEVTRGEVVESRHEVVAVQVDAHGKRVNHFGSVADLAHPIFPRSAIKPLQALVLLESGAIQKFDLKDRHLALACASHQGELIHRELAASWLVQIGLRESDLLCGAHWPAAPDAAKNEMRMLDHPSSLTNNCSGKHLGFLSACLAHGWDLKTYKEWIHPLQKKIRGILSPWMGLDMELAPWGIDGCGIPTMAADLESWTKAMIFFLAPSSAATTITDAVFNHPQLIGGSKDFNTHILQKMKGQILLKNGAEGFALLVDLKNHFAFGIKALDGAARARDAVTSMLLSRWSGMPVEAPTEIKNWNNEVTGHIRVLEHKQETRP